MSRLSIRKKLTPVETAVFCSQLEMLLRGGISAHESLLLLQEGASDANESELLELLACEVGAGAPLYDAMEKSGRFLHNAVEMVKIGETAGRLEDVLEALNRYYLRNERLKENARSAMMHPLVMLCLLVALVIVLLVRVMPVFAQVYMQLGATMSPFAYGLLSFGQWLGRSSMVIGIVLIALSVTVVLLWKRSGGKNALLRFSQRFPLTRPLMRLQNSARFCFVMALMLKSGLPFEQAAGLAQPLFEGDTAQRIQRILDSFEQEPLSVCLAKSGLFDAVDARLLQIGLRVGQLDTAMEDLAGRSEIKVDEMFSRLVGIVEPVMVALMGLVAGMVLLSVMLPLLGIMAAI